MGAKRWIGLGFFSIQPSEFIKICIILFLSRYYNDLHSSQINNLTTLSIPIFIVAMPVFLIAKQPNLGTALVILLNSIFILYLAGIKKNILLYRYL